MPTVDQSGSTIVWDERGDGEAVLLVHGGLFDPMTGERFWTLPGVVDDLANAGYRVLTIDRRFSPGRTTADFASHSWDVEADDLASVLDATDVGRAHVVAGSNGCSAAARLALRHPTADRDAHPLLAGHTDDGRKPGLVRAISHSSRTRRYRCLPRCSPPGRRPSSRRGAGRLPVWLRAPPRPPDIQLVRRPIRRRRCSNLPRDGSRAALRRPDPWPDPRGRGSARKQWQSSPHHARRTRRPVSPARCRKHSSRRDPRLDADRRLPGHAITLLRRRSSGIHVGVAAADAPRSPQCLSPGRSLNGLTVDEYSSLRRVPRVEPDGRLYCDDLDNSTCRRRNCLIQFWPRSSMFPHRSRRPSFAPG